MSEGQCLVGDEGRSTIGPPLIFDGLTLAPGFPPLGFWPFCCTSPPSPLPTPRAPHPLQIPDSMNQINDGLLDKANKGDVYTKTEIVEALDNLRQDLPSAADLADINSQLRNKADKSQTDQLQVDLAQRALQTNTYTKTQVDDAVSQVRPGICFFV